MSLHNKLGKATFDLLEVSKNRVATDLLQARSENAVQFASDEQVRQVLAVVNASLETSFNNGVDFILKVASESSTESTTKTKSTRGKKKN